MFVSTLIEGKNIKIFDIDASHNFIEVKLAKNLDLKVEKECGILKAVNSEAKPI